MIIGGSNLLKRILKSSQPESLHSGGVKHQQLETKITKVFQGRREAVHLIKAIMQSREKPASGEKLHLLVLSW